MKDNPGSASTLSGNTPRLPLNRVLRCHASPWVGTSGQLQQASLQSGTWRCYTIQRGRDYLAASELHGEVGGTPPLGRM